MEAIVSTLNIFKQFKFKTMGRYYSGDIEGKFWFGVQSSYAPERFGGEALDCYYYDDSLGEEVVDDCNVEFVVKDIDKVKKELSRIEDRTLGLPKINQMREFFDSLDRGYTQDMLNEADITEEELEEYADYILGKKILAYMEENGECIFLAEL